MMRRLFILALFLVFCGPSWGGYSDLKKALDNYQPPVELEVSDVVPLPEDLPPDQDYFEIQKQKIREMRNRLIREMDTPDLLLLFLSSPFLQELKAAAHDKAFAAKQLERGFSLDSLLVLTWMRNPEIRAQRDRFRASVEVLGQVTALDEMLRQYTAFTQTIMPGVGPMKGQPPIDKRFPFPGVTALKTQVVWHGVQAVREDLEIVRRNMLVEAVALYWNFMHAIRAEEIIRDTIELFDQLEVAATARYEAGKTSFQDVIKVRINRETLKEELKTIGEEQRNIKTRIRSILNLGGDAVVGPVKTYPLSQKVPEIKKLFNAAKKHRLELRRLRAMIQKTEKMIELAQTMILPDIAFEYALYRNEPALAVGPGAMKETFANGRRISGADGLPKNSWFVQQDAYLHEIRKNLDAQRKDLVAAKKETTVMLRTAWFDLDRAVREERLYRETITNLSKAAMDVSTRGYESGNVSFADVIGSYTLWLKAKLTLSRKTADIGIARAELTRVAGVAIEKKDSL